MRLKSPKAFFIRTGVFSLFAVGALYSLSFSTSPERTPANKPGKILPKNHVAHSHGKMTRKLSSPVLVETQLIGEAPTGPGDTYKLKATVTTSQNMDLINVKWIVPESSEIISGSVESDLGSLDIGETKEVEVLLEQKTFSNSQIHVHASGRNTAAKYTHSSQYNSLYEADLKKGLAELEQKNKEYTEELNHQKIHQ